VVEPTGAETHVLMRAAAGDLVAVLRERTTLKSGDSLTVAPEPFGTHLFDAETGARL